ncbi:MAG: exodeoxyribonuclease VII small subunit [Deltaproteobacteria bacterium CG11_big_fil_rev_8_21_14_0_20_47_16]|nr:MAG: exodeoxyribonuclease VII small subunit [Deltaproteobacteria bacterium CG11_big_fil_rev_8_21_14_0_20_47_16]
MSAKKTEETVSFEKSLEQLEGAVKKLESGTLTLDDSLKMYEEGVAWARKCESALTAAQGKIEKLIQKEDGQLSREPFNVEE